MNGWTPLLASILKDFGFPAAVASYLLFRLDSILTKLVEQQGETLILLEQIHQALLQRTGG